MPRKPNAPPAILKIESLSTGLDPTLVDDFTQEPLAQPNAKVPVAAQEILDDRNATKARIAQVVLRRVGITTKD